MIGTPSDDLLASLPSLKQKFLVDLVNGIDVTRDHIKVQKMRDGFINRIWDSITGSSNRRQAQVNDLVVTGLDSCLTWLGELTEQLTATNTALIKVSEGLTQVMISLTEVANYSADTRQQLQKFQVLVDQRMSEMEMMILNVDYRQRAHQQMDSLFASWEAGNFSTLTLAQRCFLVLTELAWGVFADYCRLAPAKDRDQILKDLQNHLFIRILSDTGLSKGDRVDSSVWFESGPLISEFDSEYRQALCFLGDRLNAAKQGMSWYTINNDLERPIKVPYIMDATRLVTGISSELISDGQFYAY